MHLAGYLETVYVQHAWVGGGGTYLEYGDMDVRRTRPPFSRPSDAPQDPHFSIFQFPKTPFLTKNPKIFDFSSKNTKIWQFFMFPSLKIG